MIKFGKVLGFKHYFVMQAQLYKLWMELIYADDFFFASLPKYLNSWQAIK